MIAALILSVVSPPSWPSSGGFAPPVRLLAAGQPVNFVEEMMYPSPVLFDIDGDGRRELVCGDLWGYLFVHEPIGEVGGVEWGASQKLQVDGEDLKVPNW